MRQGTGHHLTLFFLLFCSPLAGQTDSSFVVEAELPVVELSSGRELLTRNSTEVFDSSALSQAAANNLADLLTNQSSAFIKSYGLGSLATPSLRGSSSGQVAVLWDGLPIENPMLGLLDLSLLDPTYFSAVEMSAGSQSAGFGSGAVAGAIRLQSGAELPGRNGGQLMIGTGSFGLSSQRGHGYFVSQNGKIGARTTIVNRSADNDFRYFSPRQDEWLRQENARLEQRGMQQQIYFQPNERERFTLRLWGQQSEKALPPTTTQRSSEASQGDDFARAALHYQRRGRNTRFTLRSGLFRETINYRDPQLGLRAVSHFWKAPLEGEQNWYFPQELRLTAGLSGQWLEAETATYGTKRSQTRLAPFAALQKDWKNWQAKVSLRQETVDSDLKPPTPAVEIAWRASDQLEVNASLAKSYRLPGLNDQFWTPGGKPDLLPEQAWAQELGLHFSGRHTVHRWLAKLVAHHRLVDNWIQWAPLPGDPFWSANNLTKVRSYGLEFNQQQVWQLGKITAIFTTAAEYLRSENLVAIELPRMAAGEQLTYVPERTGRAGLQLQSRRSYLNFQQQYVGERRDNANETMEAYWLGRVTYGHDFKPARPALRAEGVARLIFKLSGSIENLWNNRQYRVIERRRMPGRHYTLNLSISI